MGTTAPPASTALPTTTTKPRSARGLIQKKIGEIAGFGGTGSIDSSQVKFTLDAIQVDAKCSAKYASRSENGHLVVLSWTIQTSADMEPAMGGMFNPHSFAVVGQDGLTEANVATAATYSCLKDSEQLPVGDLAAGSKYVGKLVLDTRSTSGVITFRPTGLDTSGGWEWPF
ncbi:hypothetical protein [Allokutzneria sp. NRRL B-24872]|uniref:hypothetical protein n=1 Tax=Allokutzneria sp. NRRL B-24872 TaxID=1137961 RepID=UPI000A35E11D|nr:hypothetical protein [Allokutzneria sp. NRRL B-24872]